MPTTAARLERKRVREVSRYYCATKFPVDNTFNGNIVSGSSCDNGLDPFPASNSLLRPARHSSDPALTAFAQLCTHKLNCQRAFIGIIDHKTHHVIAEATKTISLQFEDQHVPGDRLYCGLQALPIHFGICPSTIHVFSNPESEYAISTSNITANMSCYIIRDLTLEDSYKDRPYVTEWPFMRFYAEVPLKSPAGFVIGSLAIVDDTPRNIFTEADVAVLQEVSSVITQHLECVRLQHDSKHAGRLMQGLSSFVKEASSAKGVATTLASTSAQDKNLPPPPKRRQVVNKSPNTFRPGQESRAVFCRASNLIRQSMDLEGVVFFDARRSVSSPQSKQPVCENLGFSTKSSPLTTEALRLPPELLQELSVRYSTGKIFNFDEMGLVTVDPEEGSSHSISSTIVPKTDAAFLSATFPGAHSIIFFPLPGAGDRWYAGCFGWTFDAKRALQSEEITYFAAFSNSIMSEIFRLEAVAMDRAKSDFISSISHELRSPLHGILASAELLQACSSGPNQDSLIHMVDTCGRTLLDTMNHLFDYAKITNSSRSGSGPSNKDSPLPMSARSTLDLSELVEEVVEAVYTGHKFAQASAASSPNTNGSQYLKTPVSVILDIAGTAHWTFKSEAGAWRRIVMNLFGNALKYTEAGSISILLRTSSIQNPCDDAQLTMVEFQVSDTGKGISQEYLKNRLYTPFAQEDSLSVGTGLGLSIVRQIVTALGGSMDIQSEYGAGTTVTVLIPLEVDSADSVASDLGTRKVIEALRVREIGYATMNRDELPSSSGDRLLRTAYRTLEDWFRLDRVAFNPPVIPDMIVLEEQDIERLSNDVRLESNGLGNRAQRIPDGSSGTCLPSAVPVLLLGYSSSTQFLPISNPQRRLNQPFGPYKLARAITEILSLITLDSALSETRSEILHRPSVKRSYSSISSSLSPNKVTDMADSYMRAHYDQPPRSDGDMAAGPLSMSLLLVDDNEINLKIMSTYMRKLSCRYVTASNGLEAVECYQKAYCEGVPFDVVLMDVSMPVMDGFEATREIRSFERQAQLSKPSRIIALTGLTSGKAQEEALASGADLFLTKPMQLRKLKGVLDLT